MPGDQGSNPNSHKKISITFGSYTGTWVVSGNVREIVLSTSPLRCFNLEESALEMNFHSLEVKIGVYPWRVHRANIEKLREMMYI